MYLWTFLQYLSLPQKIIKAHRFLLFRSLLLSLVPFSIVKRRKIELLRRERNSYREKFPWIFQNLSLFCFIFPWNTFIWLNCKPVSQPVLWTLNAKSTSSQRWASKIPGTKQHQTEQMAAPGHAREKKWSCQKCKEFIQVYLTLCSNLPKP